MAVLVESVIKQEELDVEPQRVSFRDLIAESGARREKFIHYLPDGALPREEKEKKPPELTLEEVHHRRLEAIERETYQKAFAAGEEAGLALGEQAMEREMGRLLPQFEAVLRQLDGLPKRIFASAERFLVETAMLLARELVAHELSINPAELVHRVQRLLDQAAGRRDIVIYVAPDSAALLQQLPGFEKLRIEADASVGLGSVRMSSDFGGMEDDLERQLADMEAGIRDYLVDRLRSAGAEDMATAATQYGERLAAQGRGLFVPGAEAAPVAANRQSGVPADLAAPVAPAAEGAWRSSAASAVGAVRLEEIADALAEQAQGHDEQWHPSRSGSSLVGSFLAEDDAAYDDEDDASYMEETIVSTALSPRVSNSQWSEPAPVDQEAAVAQAEPVEEAEGYGGAEEEDHVSMAGIDLEGVAESESAVLAALAKMAAEAQEASVPEKDDDEVA